LNWFSATLTHLKRRPPGIVTIAWVAVAIGLLPMPYGYYMLLRLFFCGVSLFFLTRETGVREVEKWILVGLAVLYNPLVPVELGNKALWTIVNVATVVYFRVLSRRATSAPIW
jgi:uncharacterized protein DUF6804